MLKNVKISSDIIENTKSCLIDYSDLSKRISLSLSKIEYLKNKCNKRNFLIVHDGSNEDEIRNLIKDKNIIIKSSLEIKHRFSLKDYDKKNYDYIRTSLKKHYKVVNNIATTKTPENMTIVFKKIIEFISFSKMISDLTAILEKLNIEKKIRTKMDHKFSHDQNKTLNSLIIDIEKSISKLHMKQVDTKAIEILKNMSSSHYKKYYKVLFYLLVERQQMIRVLNFDKEDKENINLSKKAIIYRDSKECFEVKSIYNKVVHEVYFNRYNILEIFKNDKFKEQIANYIMLKNSCKKYDAIIIESAQNIDRYIISSLSLYSDILIVSGNTLNYNDKIGRWSNLYNFDMFKNSNGTLNLLIDDTNLYKKAMNNIKVQRQSISKSTPMLSLTIEPEKEVLRVIKTMQKEECAEKIMFVLDENDTFMYRQILKDSKVEFCTINDVEYVDGDYTFITDMSNMDNFIIYNLLNLEKSRTVIVCHVLSKYQESGLKELINSNLIAKINF